MIERGERSHRTDRHIKTLRYERSPPVTGTLSGRALPGLATSDSLKELPPAYREALPLARVEGALLSKGLPYLQRGPPRLVRLVGSSRPG